MSQTVYHRVQLLHELFIIVGNRAIQTEKQ